MERLKADFGDDMRFVFRHLPLISIHDNAQISAEASEAAGAQEKFWEMHDILFERQNNWASMSEADVIDEFVGYAEEIGVADIDQFRTDLENDTYADKVLAEYDAAVGAGLNSTPSFVMNGVNYPTEAFGFGYEGLDAFMRLMILRNDWFSQPEQVIDPEKEYIATLETENGDIVIELYPDTAPVNVNSFAFLADQGWYEGVTFHRVLPGFVAQGGDPTGLGISFPGYQCGDEVVSSRTFDKAGVVSLANSGPDSNGSQFFITYSPTPNLNANFTIIGQVIEGMDVVENITPRDPQSGSNLPPGDIIINITVEEN